MSCIRVSRLGTMCGGADWVHEGVRESKEKGLCWRHETPMLYNSNPDCIQLFKPAGPNKTYYL